PSASLTTARSRCRRCTSTLLPQRDGLVDVGLMGAGASAGPVDRHLDRPFFGAQAEVQGKIILAAAAGAGLDLARERLAARLADDARADRGAVALAGPFQADLEVVVFRGGLALAERIDPDLAPGHQGEKPIDVDVGER